MKIILILTFLTISINSFACDCKSIDNLEKAQEQAYKNHNLIFLGEVIESNTNDEYKLRIIELYKGNLTDSIVTGWTGLNLGCELFPKLEDHIWLVYTNKADKIYIDECGLSRSIRFPYLNNKNASVPPPPPNKPEDAMIWIDYQNVIIEQYKRALEVLRYEIKQLRIKRAKK